MDLFALGEQPFRHQYGQSRLADPSLVARKDDQRSVLHIVPFRIGWQRTVSYRMVSPRQAFYQTFIDATSTDTNFFHLRARWSALLTVLKKMDIRSVHA